MTFVYLRGCPTTLRSMNFECTLSGLTSTTTVSRHRRLETRQNHLVRDQNSKRQFVLDQGLAQYVQSGSTSENIKTLRQRHKAEWQPRPFNVYSRTDSRLFLPEPD